MATVDTLVWVLAAIFSLNVLAVGWLVTLELVERRRLDKEIKEVDALWRSMTTPLSVWAARGRIGGRHRAAAIHTYPAIARPRGRATIRFAVVATVVWAVVAAMGPGAQPTITSADGFVSAGVPSEPGMPRHTQVSPDPLAKEITGTNASTPSRGFSDTSTETSGVATVPATVAAQPRSSTAIYLRWAEVTAATGYAVERREEDTQQGWLTIARVEEDVTAHTDGGLDSSTTYFYRVSAMTDEGAAPPSDVVSATTPIAVPAATSVTAIATLDTIALTWTDVANETGYRIERSLGGTSDWVTIATTGQDVTAYTDAKLAPLTTYHYRIVATNAGGDSAPSDVASATTEAAQIVEVTPSPDGEGGAAAEDGAPKEDLLAAEASQDPLATEPSESPAPSP